MTFDAFADFRMDSHVAIVTGGAQNIGEATARIFSGAGAKVVIADIDYTAQDKIRAGLPNLKHRRPDVYGGEVRRD